VATTSFFIFVWAAKLSFVLRLEPLHV